MLLILVTSWEENRLNSEPLNHIYIENQIQFSHISSLNMYINTRSSSPKEVKGWTSQRHSRVFFQTIWPHQWSSLPTTKWCGVKISHIPQEPGKHGSCFCCFQEPQLFVGHLLPKPPLASSFGVNPTKPKTKQSNVLSISPIPSMDIHGTGIYMVWLVVSTHLKNTSETCIISQSISENNKSLKPPPSGIFTYTWPGWFFMVKF